MLIGQRPVISTMGHSTLAACESALKAHQSALLSKFSLSCDTRNILAMCKDELLQEKPFLERSIVRTAFVLQ